MTDDRNEAEQMRDAYAHQQERHEQGGPTSAGGAGSTSTPGNANAGGEDTDTGEAGSDTSPINPTVPPGR